MSAVGSCNGGQYTACERSGYDLYAPLEVGRTPIWGCYMAWMGLCISWHHCMRDFVSG